MISECPVLLGDIRTEEGLDRGWGAYPAPPQLDGWGPAGWGAPSPRGTRGGGVTPRGVWQEECLLLEVTTT